MGHYLRFHDWKIDPAAEVREDTFVGSETQYKYANGTFLYTFFIFGFLVVVRTSDGINFW